MALLRTIYEMFPPRARARIKVLLGSEGHKSSWMDVVKARDHARGKKRLDVIAEAMAAKFRAAGLSSLRGRRCLEFGAGNMPSEVLIFDLLGAERIVATDYNAIARLELLGDAVRSAERARILAALMPFADGIDVEARLNLLLKGDIRQKLQYVAPHDMSISPLEPRFDFINSTSVLEHLPPAIAGGIMTNVVACLEKGGRMIHEIDLQDHLDFYAPLAFLSLRDAYDPNRDFDARGNRLRRHDWLKLFATLPAATTRLIFERKCGVEKIPAELAPSWAGLSQDELTTTWIGLHTAKTG